MKKLFCVIMLLTVLTCAQAIIVNTEIGSVMVRRSKVEVTRKFTAQEVCEALGAYAVSKGKIAKSDCYIHGGTMVLKWLDETPGTINRPHQAVDYVWDQTNRDNNPCNITLTLTHFE